MPASHPVVSYRFDALALGFDFLTNTLALSISVWIAANKAIRPPV